MSYIRNILLSSVAAFAPDDEGKSAAQKERESIKVTNITDDKKDEIEAKDGDGEDEVIEDKEGEEKEAVEGEEIEEGDDDKVAKEAEEKEEVKETEAQIKERKKQERIEKKFAKERQDKKALQAEVAELKAKLASDGKEGILSKEDVEREAERIANEKITKKEQDKIEREFVTACNKLAADATKIDKTFPDKVNSMNDEIGAIPGYMIGILEDLPNGGAILNYLTDNTDDAEEIFKLSEGRMGLRLKDLSIKLTPKPKTKEISKVPDPTNPIKGNTRSPNILHDKMSDEEWIRNRNKDVAEKRAAGRYNLR